MASANLAQAGCARSWPTVRGIAAREFAANQRVVDTVDVMPLDIDFAMSSHANSPAQEIMDRFQSVARGTIQAELQRRGYQLTAIMSWDGGYTAPDGKPSYTIEPQEVVDTADSLRGYGYAQSKTRGELLCPYLPHRLGTATGADTTLYVGGWAYVGKKRTSTGKKVAKGVLIGAVIVIVIVAAIAGAKTSGDAVGGLAKGAGRVAAHSGAKIIARGAGTAAKTLGKVATTASKGVLKATLELSKTAMRVNVRTALRTLDAFGRAGIDTHIEIYGEPQYYERSLPRKGHSRMQIEMTLVDNTTGKALWHARQRFNANARSHRDTSRVMQLMLASLPVTR